MPATSLIAEYTKLADIHAASGFVGKIALGSTAILATRMHGLGVVRLVCLIVAAQSLLSGVMMKDGPAAVPMAMAALGVSSLIVCANPEGSIRPLPRAGWKVGVAIALWIWALWYPVFAVPKSPMGFLSAIFTSPVGVLPQPTIIAALIFAWSSWPNTPRLLGWSAIAAATIVGLADMFAANLWSSAILLLVAGLVAKDLLGSGVKAGVLEDDAPPVDRAREKARRAPKEDAPQGPQKVWKIK